MLDIKVLGPGCANCIKLESLVKEVVSEKNLQANIEKITDREKFPDYGIMVTPWSIMNG
ncbi:thioredoxin family protein [Ignavibacterium sp.]|uniref:thioredoxin family protein n=1 Tax=Ignavibacterium sp. TaxID=2651167 RepID=UPI00307D4966